MIRFRHSSSSVSSSEISMMEQQKKTSYRHDDSEATSFMGAQGSESSPLLLTTPLDFSSSKNDSDSSTSSSSDSTHNIARTRAVSRTCGLLDSQQQQHQNAALANEALEEQILNAVDLMEDEWDEHTYRDVIPDAIKVAIEEDLFGWSHLISSIVGHVLFTAAAFALIWYGLYYLVPNLIWTRRILAVASAITTFRTIRRRRKVWLRAAYGSKAYRNGSAQRLIDVHQADQTSWLGRLRKKRRQRKALKQLRKAESKFEAHHAKRSLGASMKAETGSSFQYCEPLTTPAIIRRRSFRTEPVPIMESIQHDQIVFSNGPILRMPYSHGGFFGAAPFLLANPHWISILRHLMPDVYVEISRRVMKAPPWKLIHWAENNPICAAYGTAQELEYNGELPNIEWDVFLDPVLVRRVNVVLLERAKFLRDTIPGMAAAQPLARPEFPPDLSQANRSILKYYNTQLRKRCKALVDKMLIAHGNLTQLIVEQTGYMKQYNYSRVKRTRRTLGGGIYARQWMAVFAESLRIGLREETPSSSPSRDNDTSDKDEPISRLDELRCVDMSIKESVLVIQEIAKRDDPIGLYLDLKSRHVPKLVWACVVDTLREAGVRVEGIGTFTDDIRGISMYTIEPVPEVMFFHSAGDLQLACHEGRIQSGDICFFNAGSLLWNPATTSPYEVLCEALLSSFDADRAKQAYCLMPHALPANQTSSSTIEHYKKHYDLKIGLYVQEFAIDETAVSLLVNLVNDSAEIYDLGLSWGGVNGITIRGIKPDRVTSTDGFWNQRYIGNLWNPTLFPPGRDDHELGRLYPGVAAMGALDETSK